MNIQDLFAGYNTHVSADEIAAEAALEGGDFNAGVTGLITGVANLNGAITGINAAITGR
ncbi:LxmA leader domain family RiPP [Streptomyces sp. NBC_01619]|uniref:LxmA leader domain family RiPP n=1 Tax=Streptomyces sp. NBC_01619 TaxID=2975901 RepID=UPI0022505903|nr:LxmA leader domain family RiPP [Streptomyces sp. NBC_01619]MCX4515857.1 LxmA leader domain family RiPP [Streptomyces sp. NBC_01619]MCX4515858.1 LxmA leader domain family RiPP [Streptomyces sp. NBC_01619]